MTKSSLTTPAIVTTIFVVVISYVRIYFGVELTDESQYVGQALVIVRGSLPFEADLFVQQTAGIVAVPFLWLFDLLSPDGGVVLALRHLYWAAACGTTVVSFFFLRRKTSADRALFLSLLYLLLIPFNLPTWSYNTVACLGVPSSMMLLFLESKHTRRCAFVAGVIGAIAIFSYPPVIVVCVVGIVAWFVLSREDIPHLVHRAWPFAVGGGTCGAVLLLATLSAGWDSIHAAVKFTESHGEFGGIQKLLVLRWQVVHGFALVLWYPASIGLIAFFWGFHRKSPRMSGRSLGLLMAVPLSQFLMDYPPQAWIIYCSFFLWCCALGAFAMSGATLAPSLAALALTSLCSGLIYSYSSANGLPNAGVGLIGALQVAVIFLSSLENYPSRMSELTAFGGVLLFLIFSNFNFLYRDAPLSYLTERIVSGPFQGLRTTVERRLYVESLEGDLRSAEQETAPETFFAAYAPDAYLMTRVKPLTGMLYLHAERWKADHLRQMLAPLVDHGRFPDLVVIRKSDPSETALQFDRLFQQLGCYKLYREKPIYRILTRDRAAQCLAPRLDEL